jgi:hypothetical protein
MDNIIDQRLSKVSHLKWFPWIGEQYFELEEKSKILIVGESHYRGDTPTEIETASLSSFTRIVVKEMAFEGQKYSTFDNLRKVLFKNGNFYPISFWNAIAFFNFVQTPMNTKNERPAYIDFHDGWKTFFEVVKILQPTTCIFIGTTASNSLIDAIKNTGFSTKGIDFHDKISNVFPKTAIINDEQGKQIQLIFIRHTGKYCSWRKWHDFLQKTIPEELKQLEKRICN